MSKEWEGEKMKKPIEQILPNPHRNFDIYPIGEQQVELLIESIEEVGMFLGLPARKTKEGYEIACGHHRLEALVRTGATHFDLSVSNYTDEEMLKIMIRENSTQRGNENFGAVLDSVGAVLVQCVRDIYDRGGKGFPPPVLESLLNSISSGEGVGHRTITEREPSLTTGHVKAALRTFRSTGLYLSLLKKGGLPEQLWHLYESKPITAVSAVSMFPKPAHAAAWVKGIKDSPRFQEKTTPETHVKIVSELMETSRTSGTPLSVNLIRETIRTLAGANLGGMAPVDNRTERTLADKAEEIVSSIKSLKKKLMRFRPEKEVSNEEIYIEDMDRVIELLVDDLEWFKAIRHEQTVDV